MNTNNPRDEEAGYGSINQPPTAEDYFLRNMDAAPCRVEEGFLNRRATTMLSEDRKGTKDSIFSKSLVDQVESAAAKKTVSVAARAVLTQVVAFFMMVLFSGVNPSLQRALMTKPKNGAKEMTFLPTTQYLVNYIISICVGNIISFAADGSKGVKGCWEFKSILKFFPALCLSSISESMQPMVLAELNGTSWRIIKQTKLSLTAIGVYFLLGSRRTSGTQWILIASISVLVFAYCIINGRKQKQGDFSHRGVQIAMVSIGFTVIAGILGDVTYKSVQHPLYIQIPQGRLTSMVVVFLFTIGYTWYYGKWDLFVFGGWSKGIFAFSCWLTVKDWTAAYILKHLDSIWKALGGVLSLLVAYAIDLTQGTELEPVAFSVITCVMLNVFAFALSKRENAANQPAKAK